MPVYRVESGTVVTGGESYKPGETFEADLSDRQVEVMEVTEVESPPQGDETDEDAPSGDSDETEGEDTSDDESSATDATGDEGEAVTAEFVEDADYAELRSAASAFDDVNGNWGEDRLRTELLSRVEDGEG